jgi:hypothetical protein
MVPLHALSSTQEELNVNGGAYIVQQVWPCGHVADASVPPLAVPTPNAALRPLRRPH